MFVKVSHWETRYLERFECHHLCFEHGKIKLFDDKNICFKYFVFDDGYFVYISDKDPLK